MVNTRPGNGLVPEWSPPSQLEFHVLKLTSIAYIAFDFDRTLYFPNVTSAFFDF